MKKEFAGWYSKTPEQLKALWEGAIIVPDTNILLHLLRHSATVRGRLMNVFESKRDALWIPYQIGSEFQRHRLDVQQQALNAYHDLSKSIASVVSQAKNQLNQHRAHPVIDIDGELATLDAYQTEFERRIAASKEAHPSEELEASFAKVTALFENRVGPKPSPDTLLAFYKEADERYAKKIPPGFEDAKKTGDEKYGDLVIWKEILAKAKAEGKPVILVTDDGKSDWWYIHSGRKIGPHPSLVEEMLSFAGQEFHIYELAQFLRYAAGSETSVDADSVRALAETLVADSQHAASVHTSARSSEMKVLRTELRIKETELDSLVNALVDFPPQSSEEAAGRERKQAMKSRIASLTDEVRSIRELLADLNDDSTT